VGIFNNKIMVKYVELMKIVAYGASLSPDIDLSTFKRSRLAKSLMVLWSLPEPSQRHYAPPRAPEPQRFWSNCLIVNA
jgi:hypothetical protein